MTDFPLPATHEHARLAQRLTEDTATLVTQPITWAGRGNAAWAKPVTANAWTARMASAFNNDPESLLEVEVRLALHGVPPEGAGALPGHGLLWLLAQQQEDRFKASAPLWQAVRQHLSRPLVHAEAALDAAEVLLSSKRADPWGLNATLYTCFMRAWREGRLSDGMDDRTVCRFLSGPLAVWNNPDVPHRALTFVSERADPSARLRLLGEMFQQAPAEYLDVDADCRQKVIAQIRDTIQQDAHLSPDDHAAVALLAHLDPRLLATVRSQSVEPPTAARKRILRCS